MSRPLTFGASLHGPVREGATVVWSDAMVGMHTGEFQSTAELFLLNESVQRDGIVQHANDDPNIDKFRRAGSAVVSLDRLDKGGGIFTIPTFTERDLDRAEGFAKRQRVLTTLEEHPLKLWGILDSGDIPPVVVNGYRSAEFKPPVALDALRNAIDTGIVGAMTVDSDASRDAYIKVGVPGSLITIIHNGIDTDRFVPSREARTDTRAELEIPSDSPVILYIGRDSPEKDIPLFLMSADTYLQNLPDAHVIMAGTGLSRQNPHFQEMLDTYLSPDDNIRNRLHDLGLYPGLPGLYAAADVLALTSKTESRPLCISEAQAAGVPVSVSTDVGDAASMIGKHGIITDRDPSEIAEAWAEAYTYRERLRFPIERRDLLGTSRMVAAYARLIRETARL